MLLKKTQNIISGEHTQLFYCDVCDKALKIKIRVRPPISPNNKHFPVLRQYQHEGILLADAGSCVD